MPAPATATPELLDWPRRPRAHLAQPLKCRSASHGATAFMHRANCFEALKPTGQEVHLGNAPT